MIMVVVMMIVVAVVLIITIINYYIINKEIKVQTRDTFYLPTSTIRLTTAFAKFV
jgi:hypothetical protein